jgi:hypothetical protein
MRKTNWAATELRYKLRLATILAWLGLGIGTAFAATNVAFASEFSGLAGAAGQLAGSATQVSAYNPLLGSVYIMAIVLIAVMVFAWKMFLTVTKLSESLSRLVDELNRRPCILEAKEAKRIDLDPDKP